MKFIVFLSLLGFTGASQASTFNSRAVNSVVVIMKEQADLTAANSITTKAEKGKFVYKTLKDTASKTQSAVRKLLDQKGVKYHPYYITNMLQVYSVDPVLIAELKARPDVKSVITNQPKRIRLPALTQVDFLGAGRAAQANIVSTGADKVWSELKVTGENIIVAGQDTGIDWTHPALKNSYAGGAGPSAKHDYYWHDSIRDPIQASANRCGYSAAAPCDDDEHGTHTIATVVGSDGGLNQIGMAPGAKWMGCRNMDAGFGQFTTYLECFEFFLAPYPVGGNSFTDGDPLKSPHVINNSWGCPPQEGCEGWELEEAVTAVSAAGILVVASAGNEGPSCGTIGHPPATYSAATLSVGAMNYTTGAIAGFSSRGPSAFDGTLGPDVAAPGVAIRSAVTGGGYGSMSGTSMAGPHVVGLAALIMSAQPALIGQPDAVAEIIRKSATATKSTQTCGGVSGQTVPNNTFGHGVINALKAVQLATGQ